MSFRSECLNMDEQRVANIVIWGLGAVGALAFVAALVAMAVMR